MTPICPYCENESRLVNGTVIYPHRTDLKHKKFYQCAPCDAYVGCHPQTDAPLGRLANKDLRKAKMAAHEAFDRLWLSQQMSRSKAYAWLAETLNIVPVVCHIGMFDVDTCRRVVAVCVDFEKNKKS